MRFIRGPQKLNRNPHLEKIKEKIKRARHEMNKLKYDPRCVHVVVVRVLAYWLKIQGEVRDLRLVLLRA